MEAFSDGGNVAADDNNSRKLTSLHSLIVIFIWNLARIGNIIANPILTLINRNNRLN